MSHTQSHSNVSFMRVISAAFLIAGACIGGGMLALPIDSAKTGFWPSFLMISLIYLFMMVTGLLIIEVTLWLEEGAHFMTMAARLFGKFGKFCTILIYLFMGYASLIAYNSAGAGLIESLFKNLLEINLSRWESGSLFAVVFGTMLYLGTKYIGRINTVLIIGMITAYFLLIGVGLRDVQLQYIKRANWDQSIFTLPLLLAVFSYQMMVPSLTPYLKRNPKALKRSIIIGLTVPYIVYIIWQLIVLGTVPYLGPHGLQNALNSGRSAADVFSYHVSSRYLSLAAQLFAFFALVTSYLGIGLGLKDFLSDLFKARKGPFGPFVMGALAVIPSLILGVSYPRAFLLGLEISGGFGDAFLSNLFPVLMVWIGRYVKKLEGPFVVFGGRSFLSILALISIFIVVVQILKLAVA